MLEQYVSDIRTATAASRTEAALQIKLEAILKRLLGSYGIEYEPSVNESLNALGLSQMDSTRPDSLFGHVVLDYKISNLLSSPRELSKAKTQIERSSIPRVADQTMLKVCYGPVSFGTVDRYAFVILTERFGSGARFLKFPNLRCSR